MTTNIRHYIPQDYPMLKEWWVAHKEMPSPISYLPPESTFILEINGVPTSCITLFFTNCTEISYLGNFISNPNTKGPDRHEGNKQLLKGVTEFAKACGFKRVLAFAKEDKLKEHYPTLGMRKTCENLDSFVLE